LHRQYRSTILCTITNNDIAPQLTVIKHVVGGIIAANAFTMQVSANSPSQNSFPGSETGVTISLSSGIYSVTEDSPFIGDYSANFSKGCTGTIYVGQSNTCIITNTQISTNSLPGKMTGGGFIVDPVIGKITHGFELNCDVNRGGNLEINWGNGNKFHLETLAFALCTNNTAIAGNKAGFNTYNGIGIGRFNSLGGVMASWTLTSGGKGNDFMQFSLVAPNGSVVISSSGYLQGGRQMAHK